MTQLYSTLANIYHEMYQHVFDYDKEFEFYDATLKKNNCKKILEIGCGSGMLARRFIANGYDYFGLDLYNEMLEIARSEVKTDRFIQCDMRNLTFQKQFESVLITGRSISYVIENKGIIDTLKGIYESLKDNGLLVFGVFEANGIFDNFDDFEQNIEHSNKKIKRTSKLKMNLTTGWTYDWFAKYTIDEGNKRSEFDDITTLRAFIKEEILLFLKLTGFKVKEMIEEAKTFTVIAEKIS
ncbi:MAG: class I SAM-dependent methyltransferase [Prolixibacteraceae bacterium]